MGKLIKSIYAGVMIGFGGTVYLSMDNKIIGAILFSFGLLTIVSQHFNLYTGKVGYDNKILDLIIAILGNMIGTFLIAYMIRISKPDLVEMASNLWINKLNQTTIQTFILSILCGIMMYLAVDNFSKTNNHKLIMLPVIIFILCGFEHSIANMFYLFLSNDVGVKPIFFILICILGNGIGARCFHIIKKKGELNYD